MRVLFAGTPEAAVPAFEKLADNFDVVAVLTRPDAPRGRGRKLEPSPIKVAATKRNIPVLTMRPSEPTFFDALNTYKPDIAAVVAYGRILRQNVLDAVPLGWLNLHFSLLPEWRGAAPVQRTIWAGEKTSGISVFRLDAGMDTGNLIARQPYPIKGEPTSGELMAQLADFGAGIYLEAFKKVENAWKKNGEKPGKPIDDLFVPQKPLTNPAHRIASKMKAKDARADLALPAPILSAHMRACDPDPGAWTMLYPSGDRRENQGDKDHPIRLRLDKVRTVPATDPGLQSWCQQANSSLAHLPVGSLIATKKHVWLVPSEAAEQGVVELLSVTAPGKRTMRASDWARGARLTPEARCA